MLEPLPEFDQLLAHTRELAQEQKRLAQRKAQTLAQLKARLVRATQLHETLFEGLSDSAWRDDDLQVPSPSDTLTYCDVENNDNRQSGVEAETNPLKQMVVAHFHFTFRGEANDYTVRMPLRYLQPDGEAVMQAEAAVQRQSRERQLAQDKREEAALALAQYEELKARFEPGVDQVAAKPGETHA